MKKLLVSTAALGLVALGSVISSPLAAGAVTFGTSSDGPSNSLQYHLDALTKNGIYIDTVNDQTGYNWFTNTSSSGSVATFMFEIAGFAGTNKFGIYNSSGTKAQLFGGVNDVSDGSTVNFLGNGDVSVFSMGFAPGNTGSPSVTNYSGFGNQFGYYLERQDGTTFYTQNSLNLNGSQQAVVYQGNNQTVLQINGRQPGVFTDNEFIIAFEDLLRIGGNSDSDFQDLVVMVESIQPTRSVPEPGTVSGLLLFGLTGVGVMLKRHRTESAKLKLFSVPNQNERV